MATSWKDGRMVTGKRGGQEVVDVQPVCGVELLGSVCQVCVCGLAMEAGPCCQSLETCTYLRWRWVACSGLAVY